MTVAARHYGIGDLSAPVRDGPSIRGAPEWWDTHTLAHTPFQTPHNITVPPLLCIMCHSRALYLMTLSIHAHTSLNVNYTWPKGTGRRRAGGQGRKKGDVFIKLNMRGGLSYMHENASNNTYAYLSKSSPLFLTSMNHVFFIPSSLSLSFPVTPSVILSPLIIQPVWVDWPEMVSTHFHLASLPLTHILCLCRSPLSLFHLSPSPSLLPRLSSLLLYQSLPTEDQYMLACFPALSLFSRSLFVYLFTPRELYWLKEKILILGGHYH